MAKDPEHRCGDSLVLLTPKFFVMRDGYPKSQLHLLVLQRRDTPELMKEAYSGPTCFCKRSDANLIREMVEAGKEAVLKLKGEGFHVRAGFHMVPSMLALHLHIISFDLDSPCLKRKEHWNSFTTEFFVEALPLADRIEAAVDDDAVSKLIRDTFNEEKGNKLKKLPLKCHRCGQPFSTLPSLKEHIVSCSSPFPFTSIL